MLKLYTVCDYFPKSVHKKDSEQSVMLKSPNDVILKGEKVTKKYTSIFNILNFFCNALKNNLRIKNTIFYK